MHPSLQVNLNAIRDNARLVIDKLGERDVEVVGVTKVSCGNRKIARALLDSGITVLGDSRIKNLKRLKLLQVPLMLLRIPMLSEVEDVVKYADISLNTEERVISALSQEAEKKDKIHQVVLMVDIGDRREGYMPDEVLNVVRKVKDYPGITLIGLGTNVGCFGGILPTRRNTKVLIELAGLIEKRLGIEISTISAGTTVTLSLVEKNNLPAEVTQFRIGEAIILGTDATGNRDIDWLRQDTVTISSEIIECKDKPFKPEGTTGQNAFGEKPEYDNKGIRRRAILGIGEQDTDPFGLTFLEDGIEVLGSSSDHTVIDIDKRKDLGLGDVVSFRPNYGALLRAFTSEYVTKEYVG